jgi:hypothetical protein
MSVLTKRDYLEKKYKEFTKELSTELCDNIFPSLDECCMIDILLYFQYTFALTEDYEEPMRTLINHHMDITEEKFQKVYPIIKKYIDELKHFLQTTSSDC